ncbi:MAG: DUF6614 family protein [Candidatus Phaeomarinobacter sp.]
MDIYHGFFDLKEQESDIGFADELSAFLEFLTLQGRIESWRLMRRKLGLGPKELGEFHLMIEVRDLTQLEDAFKQVSGRNGDTETKHASVNQKIAAITFALYRDFPDPHRIRGEEQF